MQGEIVLPIRQHKDEILVTIILLIAAFFCLGIPTIAIAALCTKYLQSYRTRREYIIFSIVSLLGFGFGTLQLEKITAAIGGEVTYLASLISVIFDPSHQRNISGTPFLTLSLATLPLSPVIGGAMDIFKRLGQALNTGDTVEEKLARAQRLEEEREFRLEQMAREQANKGTAGSCERELEIGTVMRGDVLPRKDDSIGIKQRGKWILFDDAILDQHHFVLGATGSGKTTALLRLVEQVLKDNHSRRHLIVVDGKGDEKLAQEIRALVWKHRKHDTPIFRFGGRRKGAHFDGFSGTPEAIVNRLAAMVGVQEAEGDSKYWANINKYLLQRICYSPKGPPHSFAELNKRLSMKWLFEAYNSDRDVLEELATTVREEAMPNLATQLRSFSLDFGHLIDEKGFNLEEIDTAVFSVKAIGVSDAAKRIAKFIVEVMNDLVSNWEKEDESGLLLVDEFGVFDNQNISALLSQARGSRWGVGLYTQTYAQLGDDLMAEEILSNCTTKILMGTDYPEKLGSTVGTRFQVENSIQSNEEGPTGMTSGRIQHAFKVDMNTVRRFQKGQSFVLRKGYAIAIQFSEAEITEKEVKALPPEEGWGIATAAAEPTATPPAEASYQQEGEYLEGEKTPPTEPQENPTPKKAKRGRGAATL